MVSQNESNLPVVLAPTGQKQYITYPQEVLAHWISDGELEQLSELRKDHVIEMFWGFLGVSLGALTPVVELWHRIGSAESPLTSGEFVTVMIFVVSCILTVFCAVFWWQRAKSAANLASKIRNRPKAPVGGPDGPVHDTDD